MTEPEIKLTVQKDTHWVRVSLDEDGTPLVPYGWDCGERMVEVAPGQWQAPTMVAIEKYLRDSLPDTIKRLHDRFEAADLIEQFDDPDLTCTWPDGWDWTRSRTMIPFIRKYATEIVAAIGYITSIATALGLSHQHYVSVVLGVLSTIAVVLTKFFTITRPAAKAAAK